MQSIMIMIRIHDWTWWWGRWARGGGHGGKYPDENFLQFLTVNLIIYYLGIDILS